MRVALITPFTEDATMGRYARSILPSLQRRHEVEIWCPRTGKPPIPSVSVIEFDTIEALGDGRLDQYDLIVYQVGNDAGNFNRILPLAFHVPGVHILHDYVLHNVIAHLTLDEAKDPLHYLWLMERAYGSAGRKRAEDTIAGAQAGVWETPEVERFPLFEPVLENSLGVVVHSDFYLRAVQSAFGGPAVKIDLAVAPIPPFRRASRAELGVDAEKVLLVSTGYTNRPKQHDRVIEALHRSPELAARSLFVIAGADCAVESPRLRAMVEDYGLQESVRFTGFLPEETMHSWIANADVCINLRRPNTEGASYSVIEQMMHGKAVVVIRAGFYAELPEGTVLGIAPSDLENLPQVLLRAVSDEQLRRRTGAAAREWTATRFDPSRYGLELADFLEQAHAAKPGALLRQTVKRESARLGPAMEAFKWASMASETRALFE